MLRRSARWLYHSLVYAVAISLVLFALLVTVLRYLLPQLPDVTKQVEQMLANRYQVTATIGQLSADWNSTGPQLILHQVSLNPQAAQSSVFSVPEARVHFNFWQSVRQLSLQFEQVIFAGARFEYDLRDKALQTDVSLIDLIPRFFLNQLDQVVISDSVVEVTNLLGQQRQIQVDRLSWINEGTKHQGIGQLRIADVTDSALEIRIDIRGNDPQQLNGQVYIDAESLVVTPWLQRQFQETEFVAAEFDFTLWLNFTDSSFNDGVLQLGRNRLLWQSAAQTHQLSLDQGQFKLRPIGEGWLVNNAPLTVDIDGTPVVLPSFSLAQQAGDYHFSIAELELQPWLPLLSIAGEQGAQWAENLRAQQVQGQLQARLHKPLGEPLQWWLQAQRLAWREAARVPALRAIDATLAGQGDGFGWRLQGRDVALSGEFLNASQPWQLSQLDVSGQVKLNPTWQVQIDPSSKLQLGGLPLELAGAIRPTETDVELALRVTSGPLAEPVSVLRAHLPEVMGANLYDYLNTSIIAAEVADVAMIWRGSLNDFPYLQNNGVFHARTRLRELEFKFQPDWWPLTQASTLVDFHNERMHIRAENAQLGGVNLVQVDTLIPNLVASEPFLDIRADISGPAEQLQPIFANSPLQASVGKSLTELQLKGPITGDLHLVIPLNQGEVVASGGVDLDGNTLYIQSLQQSFSHLNGRLAYRNDQISAEQLQLRWQQQPTRVDLFGEAEANSYRVNAQFFGDWFLNEPQLLQGNFNWQAQFDLVLPDDGGYSFNWRQDSNLEQLALALPKPLAKPAGEARPWQLLVSGGPDSILINSQLGTDSLLELQLDGSGQTLQQGYARIGDSGMAVPSLSANREAKFLLEFNQQALHLDAWLNAFEQVDSVWQSRAQADTDLSFLQPDLVLVNSAELWLGDFRFREATLYSWPQQQQQADSWRLRLAAKEARLEGEYQLATSDTPAQLNLNADFIELRSVVAEVAEVIEEDSTIVADPPTRIDFSRWPQVNLNCARCTYEDYNLGAVELSWQPTSSGYSLPKIIMAHSGHRMAAELEWNRQGNQLTEVRGEFSSTDVGRFLESYAITSMVQDSSAELQFDLSWQGQPQDYNHPTVNGEVQWRLAQGYLNEISDGGARLFSLLSLDGIFRKLRFDFRDVFANGLFFDAFSGTFVLDNGVVRTDNTFMDGAAGDMEVVGMANLVSQEIDYRLYFAPKVTSSLPVILAWMVNPPSGLAALLIDQVLQDAQVISRIEYRITGTMDEPIVEEIARDSREVELPALEVKDGEPNRASDGPATNQQP
ncbi:YhdP family protein [Pseudidiomarina taiwanensis]|uniref:TIGR02099 family protein n=1 Tax=Pseudidiomarina taiwanensis TaxID=337250 RepID=A0A432ZKM2_9GAMM|nr:YhdP family protein [Pseudidiomarina taiwanensis]RUO78577.1 TIGR02099 family protein [Pseudidiomarina taiwanensis]